MTEDRRVEEGWRPNQAQASSPDSERGWRPNQGSTPPAPPPPPPAGGGSISQK